jgi:hypothetical protein
MREHFVRTIADEHLFGLHAVMGGEHLAQFRRLGIGVEPQCVRRGGSHRFQRERRRTERAFVRVELHQISDTRLLAGHVGRKLTRDLAPERVHRGVRVGVVCRLMPPEDRLRQPGSPCYAAAAPLRLQLHRGGRFRRVSPIASGRSDDPLSDHRAGGQPAQRELVFMPHFRPSRRWFRTAQ